ncbi:TerB family tellurite resistance protein [Mucilaginibacter defluvii]|uniref:TerB family tellurite resistance protein n=1 Tax=Mucilaginibacter defluvii TaxID=1196019 RepID=A0ABP9FL81_9SPHI
MKKYAIGVLLFIMAGTVKAQDQEIQQLLLNVEKLAQFKSILADMKKGYEVVSTGYNKVRDISQGNFSLHKTFLDGLLAVSPAVRNYRKVGEIVSYQLKLVSEYHTAFDRFKTDNNFAPDEIAYLGRTYNNLIDQSLKNLNELFNVVTAGKMRMTDDERIAAIDRIHADMQDKLMFLRTFNKSTTVLQMQRLKERNDAQAMRKIHGIN